MKTMIAAALALLASGHAAAVTERFSCGAPGKAPTTVEIDRSAKTMMMTEHGDMKFDRMSVCASFAKILGSAASGAATRCSIAFGEGAISADYASTTGPLTFVVALALNVEAKTLTSYVRYADRTASTDTVPCKRL